MIPQKSGNRLSFESAVISWFAVPALYTPTHHPQEKSVIIFLEEIESRRAYTG